MLRYVCFAFLVIFDLNYVTCMNHWVIPKSDERYRMAQMVLNLTTDVITNQNEKMYMIRNARIDNSESVGFEIGYMTQMIQEHYRRMLDKWRNTKRDFTAFYGLEITLQLEEMEHLYWSIKHEVYMLHEIERKYTIFTALNESYEDPLMDLATPFPSQPPLGSMTRKKPDKFDQKKFFEKSKNKFGSGSGKGGFVGPDGIHSDIFGAPYTTRKPKKTYFPLQYGWDLYEWNTDT